MRNTLLAPWALLLTCAATLAPGAFAQGGAEVVPGRIFFKLHDDVALAIPRVSGQAEFDAQVGQAASAELQALHGALRGIRVDSLGPAFRTRSPFLDRCLRLHFDPAVSVHLVVRTLAALPWVAFAEPVPMNRPLYTPNDYNPNQQWFLNKINAPAAWNYAKGCGEVVIAIVDDAMDIDHPDLAPNVWRNPGEIAGNNQDDDNNGYVDDIVGWDAANGDPDPRPITWDCNAIDVLRCHGTHVAGCAMAATDNGGGIASIGFGCKLMAVKSVPDNATQNLLTSSFEGLDYAINAGADVINMSFGSNDYSNVVAGLMVAAHNLGIALVGGAGNNNNDALFYPASYPYVISVAGVAQNDAKAWYSCWGDSIDVAAPGVAILSTLPGAGYAAWEGTSMASPIVAGLVGLMRSLNPTLAPDALEQLLKQSCVNINAQNPQYDLGAGRIDAAAAMQAVHATLAAPNAPPTAAFAVYISDTCDSRVSLTYDCGNGGYPDAVAWTIVGNGVTLTASGMAPLINIPGEATYAITAIATNAFGTDTLTQALFLNANPYFEVDAGPATQVACSGVPTALAGSTTAPNVTQVQWSPTVGLTGANTLTPTLTPVLSITYTLTVKDASGCIRRDKITIATNPTPIATASMTAGGITTSDSLTVAAGTPVQLNASGGTVYTWQPFAFLSNAAIANPVATPTSPVTYKVQVAYGNGCFREKSLKIKLSPVGVSPLADDAAWLAFPNPAGDALTVRGTAAAAGPLRLTLHDLRGRRVATLQEAPQAAGPWEFAWQRPQNLPPGLYQLVLEQGGQRSVQPLALD